ALATLQEDPRTPPDVMGVAQNIAQAVGALFDAEQAKDERAGKTCIRNALGSLSQTMALLQDLKSGHRGVIAATASIAGAMSKLHPLTVVPSMAPGPGRMSSIPPAHAPHVPAAPGARRANVEANVGVSSETNFYVGFSGEIAEGGVFVATYATLEVGSLVAVTVTLPGGYEFRVPGYVHFVRDPMDMTDESEPGMGVKFEQLPSDNRELVLRFVRKRAPMFYDD
ncbi:MAG: Signal recognition particle receptor protein FtsY, partial [Myxococcaceae bacterium]|nr:Signal recognition particle receptor protein FtsY [Myxococcaceae bacterium]